LRCDLEHAPSHSGEPVGRDLAQQPINSDLGPWELIRELCCDPLGFRYAECLHQQARLDLAITAAQALFRGYRKFERVRSPPDFAASDRAYAVLIGRAEREEVLVGLLDTVLQHAGKNAFDQARYDEARSLFERALVLRESKGELDLTVSTRQALEATRRRQAAG